MKSGKTPKNKRRTLRSLVAVILAVLILGSLLTTALLTMVSAKSSSEIKKEIDALKKEAQKISDQGAALEKEIAENKSQTQTTINEKSAIDQRIQITEAEIRNANAQIQQYSLLIAEKQSELEAALQEQEEMNVRYRTRLRAMEENGKVSYWAILFRANSFSDLLDRIDQIHEIAEADQRMLKQMEELSAQIELDRKDLESELAAQESAKAALAVLEQTLQEQRAQADVLLRDLAVEAETLSAEFLANEDEEAALRAMIMSAQKDYEAALSAEEAARLAAQNKNNVAGGNSSSGKVSPNSSGFISPLPAGTSYVSCAYGWRIHPLWGDKRFHYGVDLAANANTPVYAIASGTVTTAAYGDANGYYISLSHGGGYGSLYCHLNSFAVSAGENVSQGQVIGYVGSTGWSTGPHLHFEIHLNGSTVNPVQYVTIS